MRVSVLLFAAARETAGASELSLELPDAATVGDAFQRLAADHPGLGVILRACRAAVDEEFAAPTQALTDGATIAVLPPVSGG